MDVPTDLEPRKLSFFQLELKSIWASLALCLKMTEKVSFNIASEASYVYKSSLKMPKMVNFGDFFAMVNLAVKQCYQISHSV